MVSCCNETDNLANHLEKKRVLLIVLLINAGMFFVQFCAAWAASSTALLADSLDMLGDALSYTVSLLVVQKGPRWIARAALFKGVIIALFSVVVLVEAVSKSLQASVTPHVSVMLVFSVLGLLANIICFYLLSAQRHKDLNMHSTWVCARNDMLGNLAVILTAVLVMIFHSRWPDVIVGLLFAVLLIKSASAIISRSLQQLKISRIEENKKMATY